MKVWALLLLCWWAVLSSLVVHAEEPGEKKKLLPISKKEMLAFFKSGKAVENRLITGDDIIAIIEADPQVAVTISNSIIEGGLNFITLPKTPKKKLVKGLS